MYLRNRIAQQNARFVALVTEVIFEDIYAQTVVAVGAVSARTIVPILAGQLTELYSQRGTVTAKVQALVDV